MISLVKFYKKILLLSHILIASMLIVSQAIFASNIIKRVSVDSEGNEANDANWSPSISADGRFVAFHTWSNNLIEQDINGGPGTIGNDVFVHDRLTGTTTLVNVNSEGDQSNGSSHHPSISADGRFVAFASGSTNLAPNDTNNTPDIFVHDRQTGITERVSVNSQGIEANEISRYPSISANGQFVVFHSDANNLVDEDTNNEADVFLHDRETGETTRVSIGNNNEQGNGSSTWPSMSTNGRFIAFESGATNFTDKTISGRVIYVRDREEGTTTLTSLNIDGTTGGNHQSTKQSPPSIDGRFVAFQSYASDLVPEDTNNTQDIFVRDLLNNTTKRVSVDKEGNQSNDLSWNPTISANGRFISFASSASNLINNDTNNTTDLFVYDLFTNHVTRINVDKDNNEANNGASPLRASISANNKFIAFESSASNLVPNDTNNAQDIFVAINRATFIFEDGFESSN